MNVVPKPVHRVDAHYHVFVGFPELSTRPDYIFLLADDVTTAIADVIIEPKRIEITESVGSGEIDTSNLVRSNDGDPCDVVM